MNVLTDKTPARQIWRPCPCCLNRNWKTFVWPTGMAYRFGVLAPNEPAQLWIRCQVCGNIGASVALAIPGLVIESAPNIAAWDRFSRTALAERVMSRHWLPRLVRQGMAEL